MSRPTDTAPGFRNPQANYVPGAVTGQSTTPSTLDDPYRTRTANTPTNGGYPFQSSGAANPATPAAYQGSATSTGQPTGYPMTNSGGGYPAAGYAGGYAAGFQGASASAGYRPNDGNVRATSGTTPNVGSWTPPTEPGTAQFQGGLDRSTTWTYDRAGSSIR